VTAAVVQPRVPAGQAGGGRFAAKAAPSACAGVYAVLDRWAAEREPEDGEAVREEGARTVLHVRWCPHGHTRRWADAVAPGCKVQRNCRSCHPPRTRLRSHGEE
jgi:hypothetical protein